MLSKRSVFRLLLIGGAFAAQQPVAFAADPASLATALETPIAAVSDDGQLNDLLDTHHDVNESHNQVEQEIQEGANEANNDAHEAMNDANEATQEGSHHSSATNGQHPGDMGVNNGG
jgi:hypothetical protein